jgi:hypothetical protein
VTISLAAGTREIDRDERFELIEFEVDLNSVIRTCGKVEVHRCFVYK